MNEVPFLSHVTTCCQRGIYMSMYDVCVRVRLCFKCCWRFIYYHQYLLLFSSSVLWWSFALFLFYFVCVDSLVAIYRFWDGREYCVMHTHTHTHTHTHSQGRAAQYCRISKLFFARSSPLQFNCFILSLLYVLSVPLVCDWRIKLPRNNWMCIIIRRTSIL